MECKPAVTHGSTSDQAWINGSFIAGDKELEPAVSTLIPLTVKPKRMLSLPARSFIVPNTAIRCKVGKDCATLMHWLPQSMG